MKRWTKNGRTELPITLSNECLIAVALKRVGNTLEMISMHLSVDNIQYKYVVCTGDNFARDRLVQIYADRIRLA